MINKPTLILRFAITNDKDRLSDFRISQFMSASEFELLDPKLLSEQKGNIFIVEKENIIISSMQIERSESWENLVKISNVNIPLDFDSFPTFYLSKGATTKEYRNTGLNSYLRLLTIKKADNDPEIKSLTGFVYENAPRLNLLTTLGYSFYNVSFVNTSYSRPLGKLFFVSLDKAFFSKAIEILDEESIHLKDQFDLKFEF